ncbi:MBL fold metallo-hydrolase [Chloroflexota bacterium]
MKIKWLGHSSFLITSDTGIKIITDPYFTRDGINYDEIKESADIVTVSHSHSDHTNVAGVRGNPYKVTGMPVVEVKGIKFKGVPTYHDEAMGTLRGNNNIICFEVNGIRVCHLGDLGHPLDDKQVAELNSIDILLVPVGGYFTIDAKVASQLCDRLKPKVVIPMHFKNNKCAYPIAGVEEFLKGKKDTRKRNISEEEFKQGELPASTQIIVLKSAL